MRKFLLAAAVCFIASVAAAQSVTPAEAGKHVGETVTVCGKIFGGKYMDKAAKKITLLDMGAAYPKEQLTLVIFEPLRTKLSYKPEEKWKGKTICVTGKITLFKNKPQIIIEQEDQVKE